MSLEFKTHKNTHGPSKDGQWYMIHPEGGGKAVRYSRVTSWGSVIGDRTNLEAWVQRHIAKGVVHDEKIIEQLRLLDLQEDKQEINNVLKRAARQAGQWNSADWGTAVHAMTEDYDHGFDVLSGGAPDTPAVSELKWGARHQLINNLPQIRKDVKSYMHIRDAYGLEPIKVEATVVNDDYRIAGTLDRAMRVTKPRDLPIGTDEVIIMDIKTGSVDYGEHEKILQLGNYANAKLYDHDTYERTDLEVSTETGVLIHIPKGHPDPKMVPVPLKDYRMLADLVHQIHQTRKKRYKFSKYGIGEWLSERINASRSLNELSALYVETQDYWTDSHVAQGKEQAERFKNLWNLMYMHAMNTSRLRLLKGTQWYCGHNSVESTNSSRRKWCAMS